MFSCLLCLAAVCSWLSYDRQTLQAEITMKSIKIFLVYYETVAGRDDNGKHCK